MLHYAFLCEANKQIPVILASILVARVISCQSVITLAMSDKNIRHRSTLATDRSTRWTLVFDNEK